MQAGNFLERYFHLAKRTPPTSGKVTRYRRPLNINIGMVIFFVILIYILICVFLYATSKKVAGYEVRTGSLSSDNVYRALALRAETVVPSDYNGYVNYYGKEGDHLAVGDLAYTADESGVVKEYLASQTAGTGTLSAGDLAQLGGQIESFAASFDESRFSSVYHFLDSIDGAVQELANSSVLGSLSELAAGTQGASVHYGYAAAPGAVIYNTDGYESKTFDLLTAADFDESAYEKKSLENNALVAAGDPVYKLCNDENWSVVIRTTPEKAQELEELEYVKVKFLKNQYESWGEVSTRAGEDGQTYVQLSFTNSMVTFCGDRFLDVELITQAQSGLKVPNSAIVESDFFLVPKDYLTTGSGGERGVLREVYTEDGQKSTEFVAATPYSETETDYYLDEAQLRVGDVLVKPDSADTFTVSKQDKLIGVYNINKGYADFRLINVLYKNEEYSIVQSNTTYGLAEYDYIVLDAATISPDELIYS